MVRTGLGGGIPGYDPGGGGSDEGGSSGSSGGSSGGSDPDPADEFGSELGGDPVESGGAPAPDPDPAPDPAPDPDPSPSTGGGSSSGGGGGGSTPDPADEFGSELGGDPAESGGSNTGAPGPAPAPDPVSTDFDPSIDPDFSTDPAPPPGPGRTEINDNAVGDLATGFTENVAGPLADAAAFASPATELDRVLPGSPVENSVSSFTTGAAQLANPGRRIQDAQALGSAAVEDTRNVVEDGPIEGSRENLGDARTATERALASFAGSVRSDPVGTLSRTAGSAVAGGVAARVGRNLVPDRNAADPVPSGRSNVGTEGVDVILDEDTARALQGRDTSVDRSPDV